MSTETPKTWPHDAEYGVLVPCQPEQFADFMSKLLGKPQVAEGQFFGSFDIELRDIENFYYLIEQRVTEQNKGRLLQFTSNIYFDDGTSVEVESLPGLKVYSEVRPLVSTGVVLTWVYLVQFHNSAIPEKQQIEVNIYTRQNRPLQETVVHRYRSHTERIIYGNNVEDRISYRISYTGRTWGADIENLLKDHITGLLIVEPGTIRAFIRKWESFIANFIALSLFAVAVRAGVWVAEWLSKKKNIDYEEISHLQGLSEIEQIMKKVDYIQSMISGTTFVSYMSVVLLYIALSLILSYVFAFSISEKAAAPRPAFVRLTRRAEQAKTTSLSEYEKNWSVFCGTFALASLAGVVGNILTWFVWG
jgi:hypothetical protein